MKINIYQIDTERDEKRVCFFGYNAMLKLQKDNEVNAEIYNKVYSSEADYNNLEQIFYTFNNEHPADYSARSLSVSDVVEVKDSEKIEDGFYFCDSFGFKKIDFQPEKTQDKTNNNRLKVLLVKVNEAPEVVSIEHSLKAMQELVGGYIEEYMPFRDEVAIVCNEEGKVIDLPPNRAVYMEDSNKIADVISGDFFITYAPIESEKFLDLPDDLLKKYSEKFKYPERFYRQNNEIVAYKIKPASKDLER